MAEDAELVAIDRALAAKSFHGFVQIAWDSVRREDGGPFVDAAFVRRLCGELEAWARMPGARLVANQPPVTGKSMLACVLLPAWVWTWWPEAPVICTTYQQRFAARDGGRMLALCSSPWYRSRWPRAACRDDAAVSDFRNAAGGTRFATSMAAGALGRHASLIIADDPLEPIDAMGRRALAGNEIRACLDAWRSSFARAGLPDARRLVVQQRLARDDLAGYCVRQGYRHVFAPMRAEEQDCPEADSPHDCVRDDRPVGALLWPERVSEDMVAALEREMGPYVAAAQLQQRPSPVAGGIFKREWLLARAPGWPQRDAVWAMAWDAAYKLVSKDSGSYVAGAVACRAGGKYYVARVVRGRWGVDDTEREILSLAADFPQCVAKVIEDAAFGRPVAERLARRISGVKLVRAQDGKAARAHSVVPLFAAGDVVFVDGPWVDGAVEELARFTGLPGEENDRVDAVVHVLRHLYTEGTEKYAAYVRALRNDVSRGDTRA